MTNQRTFVPVVTVLATILGLAGCAGRSAAELYGQTLPADTAIRTVQITPATTYVKVEGGEAVRFVADGKEFTWAFTAPSVTHFDLSEVAPPNVLGSGVMAFISPDPRYTP